MHDESLKSGNRKLLKIAVASLVLITGFSLFRYVRANLNCTEPRPSFMTEDSRGSLKNPIKATRITCYLGPIQSSPY